MIYLNNPIRQITPRSDKELFSYFKERKVTQIGRKLIYDLTHGTIQTLSYLIDLKSESPTMV
jgi:hypothetical protein